MRIAFAVHDARPGGGQDRYALEIVNRLSATHDVTLFARSAEGVSPEVTFRPIATPNRPAFVRARRFASQVRDAVAREKWDIVHTIGGAVPGASVITAQYCQAAARAATRRWRSQLIGAAERVYRDVDGWFAIRSERRAATHPGLSALIGVSRRTLNEWREAYSPSIRVDAVVPNGVDLQRFRPGIPADGSSLRSSLGLPTHARIALIIGALVRKGIETALRVLRELGPDVYLVAVGAGPHAKIHRLARALGVVDRLRLHAPAQDIERFYQGADLFLFPSRYEPFGMVVAEAWACGVPVVAPRTVGALEWASHGENALIVKDPTDVASFTDAATRVLDDAQLAARLSERGRVLAGQLSWERVVRDTQTVYERIVRGSG